MCLSSAYHIFQCCSERLHARWLEADVAGVTVGLVGCYVQPLYYGFFCYPVRCRCRCRHRYTRRPEPRSEAKPSTLRVLYRSQSWSTLDTRHYAATA